MQKSYKPAGICYTIFRNIYMIVAGRSANKKRVAVTATRFLFMLITLLL